jgi:hypothetical protein
VNPAEIIGIVVGALAIVTAIISGLVWLIRSQLAMQKQFQPNGGQSVRDSLNRIEAKVDNHIDWHMDRK